MLDPALYAPEPDISHIVTEDDTPVDNVFSEKQQRLLTGSLYASWHPESPFVAMANVGLFFSPHQPPIVPDVMVSLDVHLPDEVWEKRHRSYFTWEYGKAPEIVIEVVSNREGREEKKLDICARVGIVYYVIFDPDRQLGERTLRVFELQGRGFIELLHPSWLTHLGLGLTLWEGTFEDLHAVWLRWCDQEGKLLLSPFERADQEKQRADQEKERADRLAARLRELGLEE